MHTYILWIICMSLLASRVLLLSKKKNNCMAQAITFLVGDDAVNSRIFYNILIKLYVMCCTYALLELLQIRYGILYYTKMHNIYELSY